MEKRSDQELWNCRWFQGKQRGGDKKRLLAVCEKN